MARASDYLMQGYTYHLTHRCHNRKHLLRFAQDRDAYRDWLLEGIRRNRVPLYGYCLTSNHVHLIAHADSAEAVSALMHLAAGSTAKQYNLRKGHLGSMWEHPYQCTVIEDGRHLFNCLCYVDMNMVRAGVVSHPREWRWCGYDELTGSRTRYRVIDRDRLMESLGATNLKTFQDQYAEAMDRRVAEGRRTREPHWTESLAVGSKAFVESASGCYTQRRNLDVGEVGDRLPGTWVVRETREPYTAFSPPKKLA